MRPTPSRLEIGWLGPPVIRLDGAPVRTDTRKAVALLAYLTQRRAAPTRDELVTLLWPDSTPDRGRGALRRTVSTLRTALDGDWVHADRERIWFNREGATVDTDALDLTEIEPRVALEAVRGRFLEGFWLRDAPEFDDWQASVAEHFDRRVRTLLSTALEQAIDDSTPAQAIAFGERLVALDPLDETSHRALMRAHAAAGDRSAATRQFRKCVAVLEKELAVTPLPETVDLHESILGGTAVAKTRPRRRPASRTRRRVDFQGREPEMTALLEATSRPGVTWVVGPAGSGRTRLVKETLADAVVATTHAGEEGLPHALTRSLLDALIADGATEHLDERAAPAGHLHPGIARITGPAPPLTGELGPVRLLAGVAAAVSTLADGRPVVIDDLDRADPASAEAVQFMTSRATALGLRMVVVTSEQPEKAPLVRVGALPPAVLTELASRHHVDIAKLTDMTQGLPGLVVEVLSDPSPDAALDRIRQRRLDRLEPDMLQVLEALVVLGSGSPSVLAAVSGRGPDDTSRAVDTLVSLGLATASETVQPAGWVIEHVDAHLGPARCLLLHSRAADALDRSDRDAASARAWHLERAGRLAEAAVAHGEAGRRAAAIHAHETASSHLQAALATGHPDPGALHRLVGEIERSRGRYAAAVAAFHAAAAFGSDSELERSIGDVYRRWGRWALADAAFMSAEAVAAPDEIPIILADRAEVALRSGNLETAKALIHQALAAGTDDARAAARVHNVAGLVLDEPGQLEQAVSVARRAGLWDEEAAALNNLALTMVRHGEPTTALDLATRALGLLDRTGDRHRRAAIHGNLADIHHALGDEPRTREHFRIAAALYAEIGVEPGSWEPEIWKLTSW